ncbi:MAG: LLM class flavin-dependent oxidoreductase [Novosphingobium sp.]
MLQLMLFGDAEAYPSGASSVFMCHLAAAHGTLIGESCGKEYMSVRVGIGASLATSLAPDEFWRWVEFCENSGIDSIWQSDQLLGPGLDPVVLLSALAVRTKRMRFGTNALVINFRDPLVIAKEFAAIDYLSGGRLLPVFGVGAASDPYWAATGANAKERGRRANEAINLVRLFLSQDNVAFEGAHYRYHGKGILPRPAKPIPLWIGGQSIPAIKRTAALGDGWLGSLIGPEEAGATKARIESALLSLGRTIDSDHYGISLFMRFGAPDDPQVAATREQLQGRMPSNKRNATSEALVVGSPEDIIQLLQQYVRAGISKFVMLPMVSDAQDLMSQTDYLVRYVLKEIEG